jgi:diaminopimelate epimerase
MKFTKMHGCGNDYIYINGMEEKIDRTKKPKLVQQMSDRHFGAGGDGVIFINASDEADFEMEMWNADGTRGEMCGNGIRCVAKYVYDKGLTDKKEVSIISGGQVKYLELQVEDGKVVTVKVNMGKPVLAPAEIPVVMPGSMESAVDVPIIVDGKTHYMTCVSMGNPHAVIFVNDVSELDLEKIGPLFEKHELFPRRVNTEFVKVVDKNHVEMRVWERGSGETLACGTGSCAAVAACVLNGLTDNSVTVKLLGGELFIEWDREADLIYMTGPATTVYEGMYDF